MTQALYYRYWGKARPDKEIGPAYHLLPYHCLDVAAVGWQLMSPGKPMADQLAAQLQVEPEWLRSWFAFCLALHDLGKFARAFQAQRQDLSDELVKANPRMTYSERHDSLGFCLWLDVLQDKWADSLQDKDAKALETARLEPWLEIVTGHHGMPPKKALRVQNFFEAEDEQAAFSFVQDAIALFLSDFDFQPLCDRSLTKRLKSISWQLAGIAVLADWLGSDQDHFGYCDKPKDLMAYWQEVALINAGKSIGALPKTPTVSAFENIGSLFPFISQPTPLQQYAVNERLSNQPQLFILEDVTGAGKTEAALILTQRLMTQGLVDGLYVALPTMATANAMYRRLSNVYRKFYKADDQPSLVLAHGARELSQEFQDSVVLAQQAQPDSDYLELIRK